MLRYIIIVAFVLFGGLYCFGQAADGRSPLLPTDDDHDRPKSLQETLEKMRIEKDKKDHDQMISRGEQVLKITGEIEKSFEHNGRLSVGDLAKISDVEKLVKKIRTELGGEDADDGDDPDTLQEQGGKQADAVKELYSNTHILFDELKKTTRFTISAAAIESTNTVLRIARFLKVGN